MMLVPNAESKALLPGKRFTTLEMGITFPKKASTLFLNNLLHLFYGLIKKRERGEKEDRKRLTKLELPLTAVFNHSVRGWARPKPGSKNCAPSKQSGSPVQGAGTSSLNHISLHPRLHSSRRMESRVEPGLEPRHSPLWYTCSKWCYQHYTKCPPGEGISFYFFAHCHSCLIIPVFGSSKHWIL